MEEQPKVKYDPKKPKRMKRDLAELNINIRRSRKKHDNIIRKRNNFKKAIDEMVRSKSPEQRVEAPGAHYVEFKELDQAFNRAYRSYRLMGRPKIDPDTFYGLTRKKLIELISRELKELRSARIHTTTWIRFRQDSEFVEA